MSDLLVLQLRLLAHLLNSGLQLLVLVHQELSIVSGLGITIVVYQFFKLINLNFEFLVVNRTVLKSSLLLLYCFYTLLMVFLGLPVLISFLLKHIGQQLNLFVFVSNDLG